MRNDPDINIRILMRYNGWISSSSTAEEFCICNPDWQFGCIAIFSVDQCKMSHGLGTPSQSSPILFRDLGERKPLCPWIWPRTRQSHTWQWGGLVNSDTHKLLLSPQLYEDEDYQLIMNANVGKKANIWSPEARSFIRDQVQLHDNMVEKSRGKSYSELFQGIKYHESCLKDLNPENDPLPLV